MKPKTRLDNFLAKIAKDPEADTSMEPKSRKEYYLNEIAENGGSGSGYTVEKEHIQLVSEQTIDAWTESTAPPGYTGDLLLDYGTVLTELPDSITVIFNGDEYNLEKKTFRGHIDYYGATVSMHGDTVIINWSECPFVIMPGDGASWSILVENDGQTITISIDAIYNKIIPSTDFTKAVESLSKFYDFTLTPDPNNNGRYTIDFDAAGIFTPPYDLLSNIIKSHEQFFFIINPGRRITVNTVNTSAVGISLSASYIEGNVLHKFEGGLTSPRYTVVYITETTYTLTPDA